MPDLNSLPPSSPPSTIASLTTVASGRMSFGQDNTSSAPPSPRSPPLASLQAAATFNAGLHRSPSNSSHGRSPYMQRRRSSLMNNISLNDPAIPGPGEMQAHGGVTGSSSNSRLRRSSFHQGTADPNHQHQPSLGELHQELENEQEAQVNRLLHLIRVQQSELTALYRLQQNQSGSSDPSFTTSEQVRLQTTHNNVASASPHGINGQNLPFQSPVNTLPSQVSLNRAHSLSRTSSSQRARSRSGSPAVRLSPTHVGPLTEEWLLRGTRDDSAFYQAETQMLTRENQMLKLRIRELEKQISELGINPTSNQSSSALLIHSPRQHSPLRNPEVGIALQSTNSPSSSS